MDAVMNEYITNLELGPVKEFKDMAVIPLFSELKGPQYLTLKEALEQDLLIITEVDESGSVGELKVKNLADIPILLLDGEEIIGAKQNRVLNTTILVAEGSEILIPVSCTEQGRWSYKSKFKDSDVIAAHRIRRTKSATVKDSLRYEGNFRSNQRAVWNEINELSIDANVFSKTSAMKDVYQSKKQNLQEYIEAFPPLDGQNGLVVLINGTITGYEVISSDKAYKLLHSKLIKSYAMDAILSTGNAIAQKDRIVEAKIFIDETKKSNDSKHKSVSYGYDHRYETDSVIGSSLIYQGKIIHSAFFKLDPEDTRIKVVER